MKPFIVCQVRTSYSYLGTSMHGLVAIWVYMPALGCWVHTGIMTGKTLMATMAQSLTDENLVVTKSVFSHNDALKSYELAPTT